MPSPPPLTQARMISLLADAEARAFILFLGAGASRSSGIPLASEMIRDWRQKKFKEEAPSGADFLAWCRAQDWHGEDNEYSLLFEDLYPDEYARQRYIQFRVEGVFPGWGYLYLANLIRSGRFNVCFTTTPPSAPKFQLPLANGRPLFRPPDAFRRLAPPGNRGPPGAEFG